jgi:hypothetical protein
MLLRIYVCTYIYIYIYVYIHNQVHLLYKRYFVEALQLNSNTQSHWSSESTVCFQLHTLHFVSTTADLADCLTREGINLKNIEIKDFYKELPILYSKAKSPLFSFYLNFSGFFIREGKFISLKSAKNSIIYSQYDLFKEKKGFPSQKSHFFNF